jgi:16S rRNA (guanine966-N2)-methyltransferase
MKIIAGKHKNRRLIVPEKNTRPTSSMVREAVFNVLERSNLLEDIDNPIIDARIMDCFCGSGALGFEALSRGAKFVVFIDIERDIIKNLAYLAEKFHEKENVALIRSDMRDLPLAHSPCDIIFFDPPYDNVALAEKGLKEIIGKGWIHENSLIVMENKRGFKMNIPDMMQEVFNRDYGITNVRIYRI